MAPKYKKVVDKNLARMRSNWLDSSSSSSFSVLIQSTNSFLNKCAMETNSFIELKSPPKDCFGGKSLQKLQKFEKGRLYFFSTVCQYLQDT
jgi:hypothetical protein